MSNEYDVWIEKWREHAPTGEWSPPADAWPVLPVEPGDPSLTQIAQGEWPDGAKLCVLASPMHILSTDISDADIAALAAVLDEMRGLGFDGEKFDARSE